MSGEFAFLSAQNARGFVSAFCKKLKKSEQFSGNLCTLRGKSVQKVVARTYFRDQQQSKSQAQQAWRFAVRIAPAV